jgi:tripartite-type tricarboxylate transporter receptor subunit TctC
MRPILTVILIMAASLIGAASLTQPSARADEWPQRSVQIITPFPSGTGGDIAARLYAEKLAIRWGKPVIVDNRPGADGIVAVTAFKSASDEHTLLFTNGGPLTSNPFSHENLPYDPVRDFTPISSGADVFISLCAPASMNVNSLAAFVQLAKSQPGKLNWGATPGALDYIVPGFLKSVGVDMTHVSYRQIAPALQDLAAGRIHLYVSALATQLPVVTTGKARVLAVTNRERSALVADTPTAVEAGFQDLTFEAFLGFFGPRTMPAELRDRVSSDIRAVAADSAIAQRLAEIGLIVRTNAPGELADIVERERAQVAGFARSIEAKTKQ